MSRGWFFPLRLAFVLLLVLQAALPYRPALPAPAALADSDMELTPTAASPAAADPNLNLNPAPRPAAGQLALSLTAAPAVVAPGAVLTYTLTLTNSGAAPLSRLALTVTLAAGLVYLPAADAAWVYRPEASQLLGQADRLGPGQTFSSQLALRPAAALAGATVVTTATVTAAELADVVTAQAAT